MPKRKYTREERKDTRYNPNRPPKRKNPRLLKKNISKSTKSASGNKIKHSTSKAVPKDLEMYNKIIDFLLVITTLSTIVKCKDCDGDINFQICREEGLAFEIKVSCDKCTPRYIPSSEKVGDRYSINVRFAFVMRILGLGLQSCNKFCGLMDLEKSFVCKQTYSQYMKKMYSSAQKVASEFFAAAVEEEKKEILKNDGKPDEFSVSGDGTWMKPGFNSLFGVTTLIAHYCGKVIDLFVGSRACEMCNLWKHKKLGPAEYQEWYDDHVEKGECTTNHVGPSGNMETEAVKQMFQRSLEKYGIKYRNYIGDGDSKTYSGVVKDEPYGKDFIIHKKECVGHVQKRMGTRLRDLVNKTTEEVEIKSGANAGRKRRSKTLGGKGKLTGKMIDKLSVYFGLAIRRNSDSVENMKKEIRATYYHYSSTDAEPHHEYCPTSKESWCPYQKAAATNGLESFKHNYSPLPEDVLASIKPIYEDLTKDELLERCLGGFTQNSNESVNQLIWKIALKKSSGTSQLVTIAANVAGSVFNEGNFAYLSFLDEMGIDLGPSAHDWASEANKERIKKAEHEAESQTMEARIKHRQLQKEKLDSEKAANPSLYGPGIDDSV